MKHLILEPLSQPKGGRPPHSQRACLEGILFVLLTGCHWEKLPKCFPSPSTCWRRFDEWTRWGIFEGLRYSLLMELEDLQGIDWKEAAADAWFVRAKKGGIKSATPSAAKAARSSTSSIPKERLWVSTSQLPTEVKLIEPLLDNLQILGRAPEHLLYDKAADSDPLRKRLEERGIELVCPHRKGRKRKPTQDGRSVRKYKRRYTVERTHSWLHNFRRTIIRYETTMLRYTGGIQLACALITLRRL
ncbi:IS5 family transposase [Planctomicrobium sp. SH527]|uniref:IS5 family transposase n=1 Tax=Planctomicrobium sp. SH527 TaxID=3448123 RepID=UPI003F5C13B1